MPHWYEVCHQKCLLANVRPDMDRRLLKEMRRLVANYPRYGSERVHELLVGTGWRINFKRLHRL